MAEYGGEQYKKQEGGGHGYEEGRQVMVEKIKEKLPGADHRMEREHTCHAGDTVGGGEHGKVGEEGQEKKGLMDKIKDKLPGGGNQ